MVNKIMFLTYKGNSCNCKDWPIRFGQEGGTGGQGTHTAHAALNAGATSSPVYAGDEEGETGTDEESKTRRYRIRNTISLLIGDRVANAD